MTCGPKNHTSKLKHSPSTYILSLSKQIVRCSFAVASRHLMHFLFGERLIAACFIFHLTTKISKHFNWINWCDGRVSCIDIKKNCSQKWCIIPVRIYHLRQNSSCYFVYVERTPFYIFSRILFFWAHHFLLLTCIFVFFFIYFFLMNSRHAYRLLSHIHAYKHTKYFTDFPKFISLASFLSRSLRVIFHKRLSILYESFFIWFFCHSSEIWFSLCLFFYSWCIAPMNVQLNTYEGNKYKTKSISNA